MRLESGTKVRLRANGYTQLSPGLVDGAEGVVVDWDSTYKENIVRFEGFTGMIIVPEDELLFEEGGL